MITQREEQKQPERLTSFLDLLATATPKTTKTIQSKGLNDSFESARSGQLEEQDYQDANKEFNEDDFEDAHDYFDVEVIEKMKSICMQQFDSARINNYSARREEQTQQVVKKDKFMAVSVCFPRIRISILEATDLTTEVMRGIKERIGTNLARVDTNLAELALKVKGI